MPRNCSSWHRGLILLNCLFMSVTLACSPAAARPTFKPKSIVASGGSALVDLSPDQEVFTVVLSDLSVVLDSSTRKRESHRELAVTAGASGNRVEALVLVQIDAYADIQPGVRAALLVRVGDSRRTFRFPVGSGGRLFLVGTKLAVPSRVNVSVNLVLTRPNRTSRATGLLTVNSIEATIKPR
jgi:hypothetical protein